jgi:hypothetical protein
MPPTAPELLGFEDARADPPTPLLAPTPEADGLPGGLRKLRLWPLELLICIPVAPVALVAAAEAGRFCPASLSLPLALPGDTWCSSRLVSGNKCPAEKRLPALTCAVPPSTPTPAPDPTPARCRAPGALLAGVLLGRARDPAPTTVRPAGPSVLAEGRACACALPRAAVLAPTGPLSAARAGLLLLLRRAWCPGGPFRPPACMVMAAVDAGTPPTASLAPRSRRPWLSE